MFERARPCPARRFAAFVPSTLSTATLVSASAQDCRLDGVPDEQDIAEGTSDHGGWNLVPSEGGEAAFPYSGQTVSALGQGTTGIVSASSDGDVDADVVAGGSGPLDGSSYGLPVLRNGSSTFTEVGLSYMVDIPP